MIEHTHRCIHCQDRYFYQLSGEGCQRSENDKKYCPECMKVILKALEGVPKKKEIVYIKTDEVTKEQLFKWYEKPNSSPWRIEESAPWTYTRTIFMPLFDLKNDDVSHTIEVKGEDELAGNVYLLTTWGKSDKYEITKKMEKDLITGELKGVIE